MANHLWFYNEDSFWGDVLKGPVTEKEFLALIAKSDIDQKTTVLSHTRTKNKWYYAGDIPQLGKVLTAAKRRVRAAEKAEQERLEAIEAKKREERRRAKQEKAAERALQQETERKREAARERRENPQIQFAEELHGLSEKFREVTRGDLTKRDMLHEVRVIEKTIVQVKREINHTMRKIRAKASSDGAAAAALVGGVMSLVGKPGKGRSFGASSRRYVNHCKDEKLAPLYELKEGIEAMLMAISQFKHEVSNIPDTAFAADVPDSFSELIESDDPYTEAFRNDFEDLAFDVFCCLIACDGEIAAEECVVVVEKMQEIGSRYNQDQLVNNVAGFAQRFNVSGLKAFEQNVIARVGQFAEMGSPLNVILERVADIAKADGKVSKDEREFCKAIHAAMQKS